MSGSVQLSEETFALLQEKSSVLGKSVDELVIESVHAHLGRSRKASKAAYAPQVHLRQKAVVPSEAAVLFIDVQNYNCHPEGEESKHLGHVRAYCTQPCLKLIYA